MNNLENPNLEFKSNDLNFIELLKNIYDYKN